MLEEAKKELDPEGKLANIYADSEVNVENVLS